MNLQTLTTTDLAILLIILGGISLWVLNYYARQQSNAVFEPFKNSKQIRPNKVRYGFSSFIYTLPFSLLCIVLTWFLDNRNIFVWILLIPLYFLSLALSTYPYSILVIYDGKVNGATLWGWRWKRIDINLIDIDMDKVLHQNLGRKVGIIVLHSKNGRKILTVGLDNIQLSEILESASRISQ